MQLPPKTQSALRAYATKTQHLNTIQHLLDTQTQRKADTRPLEQKLLQHQERIHQAEQAPELQKIIEEQRIEQWQPGNAADAELIDFFDAAGADDLQAIIKRGTIKTPNGFVCFPDGDPLNHNSQMVAPLDGYYDVGMHGSPTMVGFGSVQANMSPRLLASLIRHSEGYNGQSIRLLSCSTGLSVDGQYCFAEELANALGVNVVAPNKDLYIGKNGQLKIGKFGDGDFINFTPNQRRRAR